MKILLSIIAATFLLAFGAAADEAKEDCGVSGEYLICEQLEPTCEPVHVYGQNWVIFQMAKKFDDPIWSGAVNHQTLGVVNFHGFEIDGGRDVEIYGIDVESESVCLIATAAFLGASL